MYNHNIESSFFNLKMPKARAKYMVLILQLYIRYPLKAVYNTMKEITIPVWLQNRLKSAEL